MKNGKSNNNSYNLIPFPGPGPTVKLFYLDFVYNDILVKRKQKIEKIRSRICQCQCSDHHRV